MDLSLDSMSSNLIAAYLRKKTRRFNIVIDILPESDRILHIATLVRFISDFVCVIYHWIDLQNAQ
jgi:hypothetical protein